MSYPPTLESRISRLPDGVDGQLRAEIGQQMQTLRGVRDAKAVLVSLSRLSLRLLRLIYERAGHKPPSDNLYDCLVTAGRGDPDRKVRGLNLVPDEIITGLHTVRTLSNKVDHALEAVQLSITDAETALSLHLRALEWFYYEADFGPRLTQGRPTAPRSWQRWALAASAMVLAGILLSLVIVGPFGQTGSSPQTVPAAVQLPDWAKHLKAVPVLELLATSEPPRPPGDFVPPRFHFDLLGRRQGEKEFRQLANGAELASGVDDYLVVVRPKSPGYLYVFQLDAGGKLSWLFRGRRAQSSTSG